MEAFSRTIPTVNDFGISRWYIYGCQQNNNLTFWWVMMSDSDFCDPEKLINQSSELPRPLWLFFFNFPVPIRDSHFLSTISSLYNLKSHQSFQKAHLEGL